jgi:16S rRNA (adenine1518-N6/adenine1519-N6)-dimethyltransferase
MDTEERAGDGFRPKPPRFVAKKHWGQHFLMDSGVVDAIVASINPGSLWPLLEIGPGSGVLTGPLLAHGARLVAIEIDPALVRFLNALYQTPALKVVEADAVRADWGALVSEAFGPGPFTVVGNLPYYVTGPLVARLWEDDYSWDRAVIMCQAEVAERLAAPVGSEKAGAPTVLLQNVATARRLLEVPPTAFDPPPEVSSSVVEIVRRPSPAVPDRLALRALVRAGFGQRRKTLVRALAATGRGADWWRRRVEGLQIDPGIRAERLSLDQWRDLSALWVREGPDADRRELV